MSWSVDLTGMSKEEFDGVLPALKTVVSANCNKNYSLQAVRLCASGHASKQPDGTYSYSTCLVKLESVGKVVT